MRIWNPWAEVFMRDSAGELLEFSTIEAAERFVKELMVNKTDVAWTGSLHIVDTETNLCCRVHASYWDGCLSYFPPLLLPFDYHVPRENWRLLMEDGSDIALGCRVRTFRGEEVKLIDSTPPGGRSAFGLVTCLNDKTNENYWVPQVVGAKFVYAPPLTPETESALLWADSRSQQDACFRLD